MDDQIWKHVDMFRSCRHVLIDGVTDLLTVGLPLSVIALAATRWVGLFTWTLTAGLRQVQDELMSRASPSQRENLKRTFKR